MLNFREIKEIHSRLDDALRMYLKAKSSKDDCIQSTMPVRASNLYAILLVLENIKGVHYPLGLTQTVKNHIIADAQLAFQDTISL